MKNKNIKILENSIFWPFIITVNFISETLRDRGTLTLYIQPEVLNTINWKKITYNVSKWGEKFELQW